MQYAAPRFFCCFIKNTFREAEVRVHVFKMSRDLAIRVVSYLALNMYTFLPDLLVLFGAIREKDAIYQNLKDRF